MAIVFAVIAVSAGLAWFSWPRPDTLIRVTRGGVAMVTDAYGRTAPLGDTVFVGGGGARRTIRVVNEDTVKHQLAMFNIPAGEQTEYNVPPGTFGGACSAHPTSTHLTFVIR
ncbi:hypothetical protein [Gemmatimonas sp.]|jgi:hypothetical protein|uniref:hypothetical protein n=1 Tax=Gemmatimonas sp. TaxID=1962908 RepID=UPI0037C04BEE